MFLRTLRQAVLSRARVKNSDQLLPLPFFRLGDAARLFTPAELDDLRGLTRLDA